MTAPTHTPTIPQSRRGPGTCEIGVGWGWAVWRCCGRRATESRQEPAAGKSTDSTRGGGCLCLCGVIGMYKYKKKHGHANGTNTHRQSKKKSKIKVLKKGERRKSRLVQQWVFYFVIGRGVDQQQQHAGCRLVPLLLLYNCNCKKKEGRLQLQRNCCCCLFYIARKKIKNKADARLSFYPRTDQPPVCIALLKAHNKHDRAFLLQRRRAAL